MEEINLEQVCTPECVEFKIYLEDLMEEKVKDDFKIINLGKVKNLIPKVFKKAELNAKYFEELRSVRNIRNQLYFRNYGVF